MSIKQFYSSAQSHDFARVFQFKLNFFGDFALDPAHTVYIETASLPGRTISNIPVPYMGLAFNVPGTASYPGSAGYNVTFRCDENYDLRSVLEAQTFKTFDENTSTGNYRTPGPENVIVMTLMGKRTNEVVRMYTLYGSYVQAIGDAAYDIKDNGTVQTITATLAYQFWRAGTPETGLSMVQDSVVPDATGVVKPWLDAGRIDEI